MIRFLLFSITAVSQSLLATEPDWLRFRGPHGSGVADAAGSPVTFGPRRNVLWKAKLLPGHSSPILVGDRAFVHRLCA
ncbi:MAG: hypothetical protein HYZ37_13145 [Candidatus Solibacter usitatus]|nr:hypothetical protein [Candidatus Solibacter usitatus]